MHGFHGHEGFLFIVIIVAIAFLFATRRDRS
jgi:hypothetical protein